MVRVIGASVWAPGHVVDVVGVCIGSRAVLGYGRVNIPLNVGAKGGRLSNIAKKIARSKALKSVARNALKKALKYGGGAQAKAALSIAKVAIDQSKRIDREVARNPDSETPDDVEVYDRDE